MKLKVKYLFFFITILIVFISFAHTLNYPWKEFDEQIIFNETYLPIASSFSQIFDYISYFGLNNHFEASNPFYSTVSNIRCDPVNNLITLFVQFFLKKNPFNYHLLSLILHILNTGILFFLINKISKSYVKTNNLLRLSLVSALTLTWSLHPVNVESVLFAANWSALLTYFLCLLLFWYFIKLESLFFKNSLILFFLFLIPIFNSEYSVTMPLILFFYSFANYRFSKENSSFPQALEFAFKRTIPLFLALFIFIIYFLSNITKANIHQASSSTSVTLERIFWLSPQIFFHFIKLILFPKHLSIDQTALVKLSQPIFEPYSIFCSILMCLTFLLLVISFYLLQKRFYYLFFISLCPFLLALLPFLHIISPAYCLASERYLYFPLLMLIFGLSHTLFFLLSKNKFGKSSAIATIIISLIPCTLGIRTHVRSIDWKDSLSLFSSSIDEIPDSLLKVLRLQMAGSILTFQHNDKESLIKGVKLLNQAQEILSKTFSRLNSENINPPAILKAYGLDSKTQEAKTAYFLALTKSGLEQDSNTAYELLKPYMQNTLLTDTPIVDFYLELLFSKNNFDEAERILRFAIKQKINPVIFIGQSIIGENKYHDLTSSEKYLKESFKYFPYDSRTLLSLKELYLKQKNLNEYARFSYLYGIRTHSEESLKDALKIFTTLNDKKMISKVNKALSIL